MLNNMVSVDRFEVVGGQIPRRLIEIQDLVDSREGENVYPPSVLPLRGAATDIEDRLIVYRAVVMCRRTLMGHGETPLDPVSEAASFVRARGVGAPRVACVSGSGLGEGLEAALQIEQRIPFADIPHMAPTTVAGHGGEMILAGLGGVFILVLSARP